MKKFIPKGFYCYESLGWCGDHLKTKECDYYSRIKIRDSKKLMKDPLMAEFKDSTIGYCSKLKCEIDDQVKMCKFNI